MSTTETQNASRDAAAGNVDMHLEVTADLASALQRAEAAHAEHQKRTGRSHLFHRPSQDKDWPAWYAAYMAAEQAGADLPA